jgi:hypothetical protein
MCTVSFSAQRDGYFLAMNRDEKLTRVAGLPPARRGFGARAGVCPSEPGGGTWIGLNDAGVTLALINWYSIPARAPAPAMSRGNVIPAALEFSSPDEVADALTRLRLDHINPFRLIGVFPATREVREWRWDLERLEAHAHPWRTNIWISSGHDEPGAQRTRGAAFAEALNETDAGTLDWLRRRHRSHAPECGPYSTCMHRADAATVSYTEVAVNSAGGSLRYAAGPPCRAVAAVTHALTTAMPQRAE